MKMFKELPVLICENEVTKSMNYLILALTAYKGAADVIFNRLLNVLNVCRIIKPLLNLEKNKKFSWNHQAIFTLIRSASNNFLVQLLGEFYDLKSKLLQREENIINNIEGRTVEEKTTNLIKWFMHNDVSDKLKSATAFDSKLVDTFKRTKK